MFDIEIAKIHIRIDNTYAYVYYLCREYIVNQCEAPDLYIQVSEEEIANEIAMAETAVSKDYAEGVCVYRQICQQLPERFQSFLMHAAVIEYQGEGYAFAAHSGTGKSTHIALWKKHFGDEVHIVNGDKPILRFIDDRLYAFGYIFYFFRWR